MRLVNRSYTHSEIGISEGLGGGSRYNPTQMGHLSNNRDTDKGFGDVIEDARSVKPTPREGIIP